MTHFPITRDYTVVKTTGEQEELHVSLDYPVLEQNGDFTVVYRLDSPSVHREMKIHGVDSLQAIFLTLLVIKNELIALRKNGTQIFWMSDENDLGLNQLEVG